MRRAISALALLLLSGLPAMAQQPTIYVRDAWARATSPSQTVGVVFLTVIDAGPADRLVSISSPAGDSVELHETSSEGAIMRMRQVDALDLAPGQTVKLKPGGYHLMVVGLKRPLMAGSSFPVTLNFETGRPITAMVTVGSAGAAGPEMGHGGMEMGNPAMHMKP